MKKKLIELNAFLRDVAGSCSNCKHLYRTPNNKNCKICQEQDNFQITKEGFEELVKIMKDIKGY